MFLNFYLFGMWTSLQRARKIWTKWLSTKNTKDIFGRTFLTNSFNWRLRQRKKSSFSFVTMSSADELLNGNGKRLLKIHTKVAPILNRSSWYIWSSIHTSLWKVRCFLKDALIRDNHSYFTQKQEWCFLLGSGILWLMSQWLHADIS